MSRIIVRVFVAAVVAVLGAQAEAFAQTLSGGWTSQDIGSVGIAGSATGSSGTFVVDGAGADVWGTADAFRFTYTTLVGDGSVVTQVNALDNVDRWTKAGVMMRESLATNSRQAFMVVSHSMGLAFQRRKSTGGSTTHTAGGTGVAPYYLKLTRTGSTINSYKSLDGATWTQVGTDTISMASTIYVGVAVTSHVTGVLATANFAHTAVAQNPVPPPPPPPVSQLRLLHWNSYHGGRRTDGVYDPANFASWIAKMNPDVVTLNEVDSTTQAERLLTELKAKMPGVPWTYYYLGNMKGNMIMSRFPIAAKSMCLVSAADNRQVAHINVVVNGRPVNVWDAHLTLASSSARTAETRAIQGCEKNWAEARIAAGDFNMQPDTAEYKSMAEQHTDAWRAAKALGTAINYPGNCDGCTRNSRIDYVFTSKGASWLVLKSAQIFDTRNASGVMASDHKPMLVIYDVK